MMLREHLVSFGYDGGDVQGAYYQNESEIEMKGSGLWKRGPV